MQNLNVLKTRQLNDCLHEAIFLVVFQSVQARADEIKKKNEKKKLLSQKHQSRKQNKQQINRQNISTKVKNSIYCY